MKRFLISLFPFFVASTSLAGWSSSGPLGGAVTAVAVAPSNAAVIWAGSSAGVFRSADGGATWTDVSGPVIDVARLVVHPNDPDRAWALSLSGGLYRTDDGGATWTNIYRGFRGIYKPTLLIDSRQPDTLYIGGACSPGFEDIFFPSTGFFKSTDGGTTWISVSLGGFDLISQCTMELAIDPFSPWRLFMAGPYSDIAGRRESYDGARTWERTSAPRPSLGVVFDARFPYTHYGITERFLPAFLVSRDGGFTWNTVATPPPATPRALSIDPQRSRLFLGTANGVFRSGDGGRVWARTLATEVNATALDFAGTPSALFAATNQGLLRIVNRGLGAPQPIDLHDIASNVAAMAVDPGDGRVLYAATNDTTSSSETPEHGRIYRSTNGGTSWERLPGDLDVKINLITVDAAGTVYASSILAGALYRRRPDDTTWTRVRSGTFISALAADPKTARTLFIQGNGVERSRDGGETWQRAGFSVEGGIRLRFPAVRRRARSPSIHWTRTRCGPPFSTTTLLTTPFSTIPPTAARIGRWSTGRSAPRSSPA